MVYHLHKVSALHRQLKGKLHLQSCRFFLRNIFLVAHIFLRCPQLLLLTQTQLNNVQPPPFPSASPPFIFGYDDRCAVLQVNTYLKLPLIRYHHASSQPGGVSITEQNKGTHSQRRLSRAHAVSRASTCQGKPSVLLGTPAKVVWPLLLIHGRRRMWWALAAAVTA